MEIINTVLQYGQEHLFQLGLFSIVFFFGSLVVIPVIVVHLPENYFVTQKKMSEKRSPLRRFTRLIFLVIKNGIGLLLLMAGIVMLFVPGQGLITIVIGLSLLDFPGKHTLQNYCVEAGSVQKTMNWIRKKNGRQSLKFNENNNSNRTKAQ